MQTFLTLHHEYDERLPDGGENDVRTPRAAVGRVLREFSEPGDVEGEPVLTRNVEDFVRLGFEVETY